MVSLFTSDGRHLQFHRDDRVHQLGTWSQTMVYAKAVPVEDLRPGSWIVLRGAKDRTSTLDIVRVESVALSRTK